DQPPGDTSAEMPHPSAIEHHVIHVTGRQTGERTLETAAIRAADPAAQGHPRDAVRGGVHPIQQLQARGGGMASAAQLEVELECGPGPGGICQGRSSLRSSAASFSYWPCTSTTGASRLRKRSGFQTSM